jgi:hypothetical protein
MALRTKTIEYCWPTNTSNLALGTNYDFAAISISVPENTSRTFRSVVVEVGCRDNVTTATSMTSWTIATQIDAVAFTNATSVTDTITNSGEQQTFLFTGDATAYFVTNFTGTSHSVGIRVNFGALATINIWAKVYITYEFDDASQDTRIKTVRIPLESNTGNLTNTLASVGSSQIPNLDTFLPEASKTYRRVWFEISGNENCTAVTDSILGVRLDAEAEITFGNIENGLNSSCWSKYMWVRNDMTTNATHDFQARITASSGSAYSNLCVLLCVTYEYSHTSSTTIINSVVFSTLQEDGLLQATASGDAQRYVKTFRVAEPGTITLVQSGVFCTLSENAGLTVNIRGGSQTYRAYVISAGTLTCGQLAFIRRLDSGAAGGAGITLARGRNTFTLEWYATTVAGTNLSGLMYLNYTSGKHALGDGVHNHSTHWNIMSTAADTARHTTAAGGTAPHRTPNIPETSYMTNGVTFVTHAYTNAPAVWSIGLAGEVMNSGEAAGDGWESIYLSVGRSDTETGVYQCFFAGRSTFNRWPGDPNAMLDLETGSRRYRLDFIGAAQWAGLYLWLTYHAITYQVRGNLVNYTGTGSGIVVQFFNAVTHEYLGTATTTTGGAYSFTWYDDVQAVYAAVRQDATHVGRTDNLTPI